MAAGQGLEPQLIASEAIVLPLDEPAMRLLYHEAGYFKYLLMARKLEKTPKMMPEPKMIRQICQKLAR